MFNTIQDKILFSIYSYFENFGYALLELSPPILRSNIFKLLFKKFGFGVNIDYKTYFRYPWKISIGDNVFINRGCNFYASYRIKDAEIIIGSNIAIGPEVTIFSAGHNYHSLNLDDIARTVKICDYVWIGGKSVILPGVEIGEGSVIGAGSVVTKSIQPYCVAVGNPAHVVKRRKINGDPKMRP